MKEGSVIAAPQARIGAVDGLRALAMTMVVLQHCHLLPFGWQGVWVFYVISGFVVCRTYHRDSLAQPEHPYRVVRGFFIRRALRIWPVYFLYIGATIAIFAMLGYALHLPELATLVGFVYNWQMILQFAGPLSDWAGFGHLWTISVEQQFYVIFPLLYVAAFAAKPRAWIVIALLLASPVIRYSLAAWMHASGRSDEVAAFAVYASSIGHFDSFMVGALLGRYQKEITSHPWIERAAWGAAIGAATIYIAAEIGINVLVDRRQGIEIATDIVSGVLYSQLQEVFVYYVPMLACAALIVSTLKGRRFMNVFALGPVRWIGEISYGCYIYHIVLVLFWMGVLHIAGNAGFATSILLFALTYASTLIVAAISYYAFERPVRRLRFGPHHKAGYKPAPEPT
jgi:peptidoglycan/LPS O-acetylase OafA/YrhL